MSSPLRIEGATLRETPTLLASPWMRYAASAGAICAGLCLLVASSPYPDPYPPSALSS